LTKDPPHRSSEDQKFIDRIVADPDVRRIVLKTLRLKGDEREAVESLAKHVCAQNGDE
jgi:hypothetical protein